MDRRGVKSLSEEKGVVIVKDGVDGKLPEEANAWGYANFLPKEDKFEICHALLQKYAKETEEGEPGALKFTIYAEAATSWFAGRRVVETKGIILMVEEFSSYTAYCDHAKGAARQNLDKTLRENKMAEVNYGEMLPCGGFSRKPRQ